MSFSEQQYIRTLSLLVLSPEKAPEALAFISSLSEGERERLLKIADSNHVIMRAMSVLHQAAQLESNDLIAYWALRNMQLETSRIGLAVSYLANICQELESNGCPVVVMKSLDHWPDLGSDLDLYTTADERQLVRVFTTKLRAQVEPRSWGDRLAQKWNFKIPGLRESV